MGHENITITELDQMMPTILASAAISKDKLGYERPQNLILLLLLRNISQTGRAYHLTVLAYLSRSQRDATVRKWLAWRFPKKVRMTQATARYSWSTAYHPY